ncbi:hypothetical protein Drorol1_Dr00008903 [Drosera rotundifolia]
MIWPNVLVVNRPKSKAKAQNPCFSPSATVAGEDSGKLPELARCKETFSSTLTLASCSSSLELIHDDGQFHHFFSLSFPYQKSILLHPISATPWWSEFKRSFNEVPLC